MGALHRTKEAVESLESYACVQDVGLVGASDSLDGDRVLRAAKRIAAIEAIGLLFADGIVCTVSQYDQSGVSGGQTGRVRSLPG